jgi:hypothetical protein
MDLRKILTFVDETLMEAGKPGDPPLRKVAVVALLKNPFAGAYVEDLKPLTDASLALGERISAMGVEAMRPYPVLSYGKAGLVGVAGEQEHAVAMLTTVYGNAMRDAVGGGTAWISSMTKRVSAGATVDVPLAHKDALYVRAQYDGITLTIPDGPLPDEIAIIAAFANRGRLNHRVGGLAVDEIKGSDGLV